MDGTLVRSAVVGEARSSDAIGSALSLDEGGFLVVGAGSEVSYETGEMQRIGCVLVARVDGELNVTNERTTCYPWSYQAGAGAPMLVEGQNEILLPIFLNRFEEDDGQTSLLFEWLDSSDASVLRSVELGEGEWRLPLALWRNSEGGFGVLVNESRTSSDTRILSLGPTGDTCEP